MEKTTLYLSDDLHRKLKVEARRRSRSQADIVREALRNYLEGQPRMVLSSLGAGEDSGLAARDTKSWLAEEWAAKQ